MKHFFQHPFHFCLLACLIASACSSCKKKPMTPNGMDGDLTDIPYNPQTYTIKKPTNFPEILVPLSNPMTIEGVALGRRLFYDPILSGDSTQSCSSCHAPAGSFTDNKAKSKGIDGLVGKRSAMSLLNIAYVTDTFLFWDGRSKNLEDQALLPVEDPIEMHNTWPNAISRFKNHPQYPEWFRKAFGIADVNEITKELAAKALAQFERTLVSSGKSKYDLSKTGQLDLEDDEIDGELMYFDDGASLGLPDAQCFHCHGGITLTGGKFFNNGLENVASPTDFPDLGLGGFNKNPSDNGKFRAPTLRNIAMSAPYMHDGRFQTLEEVLDHYGNHDTQSPNEDIFIDQIGFKIPGSNPLRYDTLSTEHKQKIIKFLHTLTDPDFMNNPEFQNPWQ